MKKLNKTVFFSVIVLVLFFIFGLKKIFQPYPEIKKEYDYLSLVAEVTKLVKTDYVEDVSPGEKFPGGFSRMLSSLDPSSTYLDVPKSEIYRLYQQDKTYGCGIYGSIRANYFYISDIAPGSPAETRGLKAGDTLKAINGKSVYGQSFWGVYLSLQTSKPESLEVILLENKNRSSKPGKIKLTTAFIDSSLQVKNIEDNILLVELPRFDAKNIAHLKEKLGNESSLHQPLKLIIDLRKYYGGDLDAFVQLTKLFFPQPIQLILKTKQKKEKILLGSSQTISYFAVIIINKSTRMYGELLAALFKEYGKENVTLVGTKTSGLVSKIKQFPLHDGSSILLTEGIFLLNGKKLAYKGVTPNIKIKEKYPAKMINRAAAVLKETHD